MNPWKYRFSMFWKYRDLMIELVSRDIKLKYRRSFLGYLWSILDPLFVMIVITIVFSAMFHNKIENFPVYLFTGRMMYSFLATSTKQAMGSVVSNASLIKKTYVPKYVFTFAKVTYNMVDLLFSFGALFIVIIATRARLTPYFLLFPLVVLQIYLFCMGLGFCLAALNVFFRDIQYIYNAVLTAWMYMTPIFYPIENLPEDLQIFIKVCNPLYYYVAQFRDIAYYGQFPGPRIFWGGWLLAFAAMAFGLWVFKKNQDNFILHI